MPIEIPSKILDFGGSNTTEELESHLGVLEMLHHSLPDSELGLAIEVMKQMIETKSQGRFFLFYGDDGEIHGDSYLPDGYLLYQQLGESLTPILLCPLRSENDPVRVVEGIQEIVEYLLQKGIDTIYTFNWDRSFPGLTNGNEHHGLSIGKPSDSIQRESIADELEKNNIRMIEQN